MCFQKIYQSLKVDLEILEQQWNSEHGRTSIQEHPHDLSHSLPAHISNMNKGFCPLKKVSLCLKGKVLVNYQEESNLAVTEKSVWVFHKFDLGKGNETNQSLENTVAR